MKPVSDRKMFFVGGMPRAGSTMIMNILGQNPRFRVTPTSGLVDLIYTMRQNFTNGEAFRAQDEDEMNRRFRNALRGALWGWAEDDKPVYVDKSRGWIQFFELLRELSPDAKTPPKIIVPVRDIRGVAASFEKLFRANVLRINAVEVMNQLRGLTTEDRVMQWLNGVPVGMAIQRIHDSFTRGVAGGCCFVRMEDLCKDPDAQLDVMYEYLGEERYAHDLENIEQITEEDDRVYGIPGLHEVHSKVVPVSEDWSEVLGSGLASQIKQKFPWFYQRFYAERV